MDHAIQHFIDCAVATTGENEIGSFVNAAACDASGRLRPLGRRLLSSDTLRGKLADAEVHFAEGTLEGLKLIGFSIWERRGGGAGRNVTFPARSYAVNGERRNFALLRPIADATAQEKLRALILNAYQEYEERAAIPT